MIQLHGCGLFNIPKLLGNEHHIASTPLQLIIELAPELHYEENPLDVTRKYENMLGFEIPKLIIPLPSSRNLALVIELLVRREIAEK